MNGRPQPSVLFVCTGNAGRSQMAQTLFRELVGGEAHVESAGVAPWGRLHPMAVKLMGERGIGLEGQHPKPVSEVMDRAFDFVVTLGDPARARLSKGPFTSAYWMHWDIPDPADADGTPGSEAAFRTAAGAIEARLPGLREQVRRLGRLSAYAGQPGIATGIWYPGRFIPAEHLPLVQKAGFRAIELNLYKGRDHFDWENTAAVHDLQKVAQDLGILIWSIHAPDLGSIAAADPAERQRQTDVMRTCLDLADRLGARAIPSHALLLGPFEQDPEGCEARIAAFLEDLAGEAEGNPAQVAFENPGYACAPAARSVPVLHRLDGASRAAYGFVLDTGHANIDGDLTEIGAHVRDHLISLHLNDNDGRKDAHLAPGEGSVDWAAVRDVLRTGGYRGVTLYEIEGNGQDPGERMRTTMEGHRRYFTEA